MRAVDKRGAYIVLALIVLIALVLFASHEFFPFFTPAGSPAATK